LLGNNSSRDAYSCSGSIINRSSSVAGSGKLASFAYLQQDIHMADLAAQLRARISAANVDHYESGVNELIASRRLSAPPYSGGKVVVVAMHCCGALSVRAIELFAQLDAAALLLMPCCLPPKAPRASTTWNPHRSEPAGTAQPAATATALVTTAALPEAGAGTTEVAEAMADSATTNAGRSSRGSRCGKVAMADVFSTKDQAEQYARWARHLCDACAAPTGADADTATVTIKRAATKSSSGVAAGLRTISAVLSARNVLVTGVRLGGALGGAAHY
jgi:hypothetical protein